MHVVEGLLFVAWLHDCTSCVSACSAIYLNVRAVETGFKLNLNFVYVSALLRARVMASLLVSHIVAS